MTDTNNVNLNNRPELSIIIPVYKVELYLKPCLDSVLAQTFTDWELILVDDGSPDNSGRICDEYAAKDSRIRVIHKSNGGVAAARNAALNITRGRYITFVDSDDEYGTDTTLEENMAILKADPSIDFLQYPYIYVDGIGNHVSAVPGQLLKSKADVLNFMLDDRITGYLWTKIFRADLFDGMRFPENVIITEDMHLLIDLQAKVHSVYLSVSGLYRYYKRDTGIVMLKTREKEMECANTYRKLLSVAAQCDDVDSIALARRFFGTLSHLLFIYAQYGGDDLEKGLNELSPYMPDLKLISGKLKLKYKLKVLQIKILGLRRYAKLNIYFKRKRLNTHTS